MGRGGGSSAKNSDSGTTSVTITIPKAASSSTDINLLGDFTPTYATANFHYGIYFKNDARTSETQYATAGGSVTFDNVEYDTYDFFLDIYVDKNKRIKLGTEKIPGKTISASDNTVQFPDMKTSDYSEWYFVKDSADLTTAISEIEAGGYTEASPAKLCLTATIEDERATEIKNNNKIDIVYNDFELEPHLYDITISPVTGGTVTADREKASAGKTVTLTVTPDTGMKLYSISVSKGSDAAAGITTTAVSEGVSYTFTMPDDDVTVSAVFKRYYTVTVNSHAGTAVGTPQTYFEDDELTFDDAKAILADSVPTGREIVAFKRTSTTPVVVYKESDFPIIFSSTNFSSSDVTLQACLDLTHSRVEGGGGYEPAGYAFDTQNGTDTNPYLLNYYGNDTNKRNQVTIEISGHICADSELTIESENSIIVDTYFDSISCTDSKILIRIKSDLVTNSVYTGTIKLTVTDPTTGATTDFYVLILKGKVGSKNAPDTEGDIVFSDGSAEPYSEGLTLSAAQKAEAIAVIFDATNKKGVGLVQGNNLKWADDSNLPSSDMLIVVKANSADTASTVQFSGNGANDGSSNLTNFQSAVGTNLTSTNYPAWYWIVNYATNASLTGTSYATGWYMPSINELCALYNVKETVNNSIGTTNGTQLSNNYYWSSSQYSGNVYNAWCIHFSAGSLYYDDKSNFNTYRVCAVRKFSD